MKVAIITDVHIGARNDSLVIADHQRRFFEQTFMPTLIERGIKHVICMGDIFDRRKYVNFKTLDLAKEYWFDPMKAAGITMDITVGNHDCYYRNTNSVNSPQLLLSEKYDNITIYSEPTEINIDGRDILYLPWINDENREAALKLIANTNAKLVMGHLELTGFQMYAGSVMQHGMERTLFDKFDKVLTGHYHHKSDDGRIFYLGSPLEYTWSDYNDPRGFHIFDTDTMELEYIQNPVRIFRKIYFDDRGMGEIQKQKMVYEFKQTLHEYTDCYVRVMVRGKESQAMFDQLMSLLDTAGCIDISVTEDASLVESINESDVDMAEDTLTILKKHIDGLTMQENIKDDLKGYMQKLYQTAHEIGQI